MNKYLIILLGLFSISIISAQDITTIEAKDQDISDNLDLEAVAVIFGIAKNLEDFEKKLNNPETRISNLDLNQDGYVDYLRVVESVVARNARLITIQAVLEKDIFQDVATIDVVRDSQKNTRVQFIGDIFLYGDNYFFEPFYSFDPIICDWFWSSDWRIWISPWYCDNYPQYWIQWTPCPFTNYYTHVQTHHINMHHTFHYTTIRRSIDCLQIQSVIRRNDYEIKNPKTNFEARQPSSLNKNYFDQKRGLKPHENPINNESKNISTKRANNDWQTNAEKKGNSSSVKNHKITITTKGDTPQNAFNKPNNAQHSWQKKSKKRARQIYEDDHEDDASEPVQETQEYERYDVPTIRETPQQEPREYHSSEPQSKPTKVESSPPVSKPRATSTKSSPKGKK